MNYPLLSKIYLILCWVLFIFILIVTPIPSIEGSASFTLYDKFFHFFYGKSPLVLRLQGVIFNTSGYKGAPEFSLLYKYLLRLSMVTKTHIVPNIEFRNCIASGAFLSMNKTQTSQEMDHVKFNAEVLTFRLDYTNSENKNNNSVNIRYFEEPATADS